MERYVFKPFRDFGSKPSTAPFVKGVKRMELLGVQEGCKVIHVNVNI